MAIAIEAVGRSFPADIDPIKEYYSKEWFHEGPIPQIATPTNPVIAVQAEVLRMYMEVSEEFNFRNWTNGKREGSFGEQFLGKSLFTEFQINGQMPITFNVSDHDYDPLIAHQSAVVSLQKMEFLDDAQKFQDERMVSRAVASQQSEEMGWLKHPHLPFRAVLDRKPGEFDIMLLHGFTLQHIPDIVSNKP